MTTRTMKDVLSALGKEAAKAIERPADPKVVMETFCQAMTARTGRPIQLVFRTFPATVLVSGLRMDLGDSSLIVVDERSVPESQLVILGHELWHEEQGDCANHVGGVSAAARVLTTEQPAETIQKAAQQILEAHEVPPTALQAVAARADSHDAHEVEAETFGLLFGREVRTWMTGRYAQNPVNPSTVEGRLNLSLFGRGGRIIG